MAHLSTSGTLLHTNVSDLLFKNKVFIIDCCLTWQILTPTQQEKEDCMDFGQSNLHATRQN